MAQKSYLPLWFNFFTLTVGTWPTANPFQHKRQRSPLRISTRSHLFAQKPRNLLNTKGMVPQTCNPRCCLGRVAKLLPGPRYQAIKHSKLVSLQTCISHTYFEFPSDVSARYSLVFSVPGLGIFYVIDTVFNLPLPHPLSPSKIKPGSPRRIFFLSSSV